MEEDQQRKGRKKEKRRKSCRRLRPEKDGRRKIRRQQAMDTAGPAEAQKEKSRNAFLHTASDGAIVFSRRFLSAVQPELHPYLSAEYNNPRNIRIRVDGGGSKREDCGPNGQLRISAGRTGREKRNLADLMERDIKCGKLSANTKLPPQRELADYLDLNLSTITKAYKLCEMRGLIHAVTGKGTFVTPYANVPTSTVEKNMAPGIELAVIHPFYESNEAIRDLTIDILKKPFSEQLFEYSHPLGDRGQILTAARWLQRFGLDAPEHCIYVSGLSKPLCPGLRIAYLYLPDKYVNPMEQGIFSQNLKISSLNMEIAAELIRSGLAWKIIQKKRNAAFARNEIYASCFPESSLRKESYYQWLELPDNLSGRLCEAELSCRGVSVFGAERFTVGNQGKTNAVRIATCSAKNEEQLRKGLEILLNFIRQQEDREPLFIV